MTTLTAALEDAADLYNARNRQTSRRPAQMAFAGAGGFARWRDRPAIRRAAPAQSKWAGARAPAHR